MLATLGDLVEDLVVRVDDPIHVASDTAATIRRRRGGSAANVAAVAASHGHPTRFLGQVGDDPIGAALVADLGQKGVDVAFVRRRGRTGTIVVLVDPTGERTMLTDRGSCESLVDPDPRWLDGVSTLHVPLYSFAGGETARTASLLMAWADQRKIARSIDVSSVASIDEMGAAAVHALLAGLRPQVVFANEAEAEALAIEGSLGGSITIVKRGAAPALVHRPTDNLVEVPTDAIDGAVDTTGAGDAFAAGFLTASWRTDPIGAVAAAHRTAQRLLLG